MLSNLPYLWKGIQVPDFLAVQSSGTLAAMIPGGVGVYTENGVVTPFPGAVAGGGGRLRGMKVGFATKEASQWNAQHYQGDQGTAVMWFENAYPSSEGGDRWFWRVQPISANASSYVYLRKVGANNLRAATKNGAESNLNLVTNNTVMPADKPTMVTIHWLTNFVKIVVNGGDLSATDTSVTLGSSGDLVNPHARMGVESSLTISNNTVIGMFAIWKRIQANVSDSTDMLWEQNVFNRTRSIFGRDK